MYKLRFINVYPYFPVRKGGEVHLEVIETQQKIKVRVSEPVLKDISFCLLDGKKLRPSSRDVALQVLSFAGFKNEKIVFHNFIGGTFIVDICCEKDGEKYKIDSTGMDAVAMSKIGNIPMFITANTLEELEAKDPSLITVMELLDMTTEELKEEADEALNSGDYEKCESIKYAYKIVKKPIIRKSR